MYKWVEKKEKLGKKIYITGKGRCNVTNDCSRDVFFDQVVTNPKFLYSAFETFDNQAVMQLLEQAGCPLKTERGNRVFPVSDHSSDVIRALERLLQREGVKVHLCSSVKRVLEEDGQAVGIPFALGWLNQYFAIVHIGKLWYRFWVLLWCCSSSWLLKF